MPQLDALRLVHSLRKRLVEFSIEETFLRDETLRDILRTVWSSGPEAGGLLSELWVEAAFGAATCQSPPHTVQHLVDAGQFDRELAQHLDRRGAFPIDRPLYSHQRDAIQRARMVGADRPAIMVTAGTGAGKTESFLLPILDELWRSPRTPGEQGVRCIILYPMNALVNDQIDRLYGWLRHQQRLSLFHLTSETPEDHGHANQMGVPRWDSCRHRTRRQARGLETADGRKRAHTDRGPVPDILITNYSMLEYMLCRPQDAMFFGPALRSAVLDEAHLYTGTLAAEIALLLRRVLVRCGLSPRQVLHICTSATLGEGDLSELGSKLLTKPVELVHVIRGTRKHPDILATQGPQASSPNQAQLDALAALAGISAPTLTATADGESELATSPSACDVLEPALQELTNRETVAAARGACAEQPGPFLHRALSSAAGARLLAHVLWTRPRLSINHLAEALWGTANADAVAATIAFLRLTSSARLQAADLPLVPHRLHVLCRCPDGAVVCLNPACTAPRSMKPSGWGALCTGFAEMCPHCGSRTLSVLRCDDCGHAVVAGVQTNDFCLRPIPPDAFRDQNQPGHTVPGAMVFELSVSPASEGRGCVHVDLSSGQMTGPGTNTRGLIPVDNAAECSNCRSVGDSPLKFEPVAAPLSLTMSVIAETILAGLPEYPSADREFLPARGRRLLAFTDSRQGAARLGPRLTSQHETQLLRAALVRAVQSHASTPEVEQYLVDQIADLQRRLESSPATLTATLKRDLTRCEVELASARGGLGIRQLADLLARAPVTAELLDADTAGNHRHSPDHPWSRSSWAENAASARKSLARLLCEEVAIPLRPHRATSAEAVALIEIVLPGVETLHPQATDVASFSEPMQAIQRILGTLPQELAQGLREDWTSFLTELVLDLRRNMAVTLGLGEEADEDFVRQLVGTDAVAGLYLTRQTFAGSSERATRLARVAQFFTERGVPKESALSVAQDLLGYIFDLLLHSVASPGQCPWLETDGKGGLRLNLLNLCVRRPRRLFVSSTTGLVFPRAVLGRAILHGIPDLIPTNIESALNSPRLARRRRELLGTSADESDVFGSGLWGEEHSAQLSPQENLRLQNLFRAGARNVLSSTTTLELGIDIGGLAGVMLTDVPPGVANYTQRAGRAGRRADGSSIVVTFARPRPFDREVFQRFGQFLSKSPPTPNVFLNRARIVERHAYAFLLGEFFRAVYPTEAHVGAMTAYRLMGEFCGMPMSRHWNIREDPVRPAGAPPSTAHAPPDRPVWWPDDGAQRCLRDLCLCFLEHLSAHAQDPRREGLTRLFQSTPLASLGTSDSVATSGFIREAAVRLEEADAEWRSLYREFYEGWDRTDPRDQPASGLANALHRNLEAMYSTTTIEALADTQYLPRYGFPIGLLRLSVWTGDPRRASGVREEDRFRLERNGMLALREYAPGATLVVGGSVVRSRGLMKHWTGVDKPETLGLRGRGLIGPQGRFVYRLGESELPDTFPSSGESTRFAHHFELLFPRHGFSTAWWDRPLRTRSLVDPVGSVQLASSAVIEAGDWNEVRADFARIRGLTARYRECGELLVYNPGDRVTDDTGRPRFTGFAICTRCGFAEIERTADGSGRLQLPSPFEGHRPLRRMERRSTCWAGIENAPVLRHQVLAARENTDVLVLELGRLIPAGSPQIAKTLAEALRLSGARHLQLDARELGARFHPVLDGGFAVVLFDCHPGGAGHVFELLNDADRWLRGSLRETLFVSEEHHARCRTACLDCLRTFAEPSNEDGVEFDRLSTLAWLDALLAR